MPKDKRDLIDIIQPSTTEAIDRKMKHLTFVKVIYWLGEKSKHSDFIYTAELCRYLRFSKTRAYQILRELCDLGLLVRKGLSPTVEFHFVNNSNKPKLMEYFEKAKKILETYFQND